MSPTRTIDTTANASVRISNQHAALRVDRRIHEVQQVAIVWTVAVATRRAQVADRTALYGISRRRINSGPGRSAIKCGCDVKMPRRALIVRSLVSVIARHSRAEECIRRPIVITGDDFRER